MPAMDIESCASALPRNTPSKKTLQEAAEWFALLRSGEARERDHEQWQIWLAQDPAHRDAWGCIETISRHFEPVQAEGSKHAAVHVFQNTHRKLAQRRKLLLGMTLVTGTGLLSWLGMRHQLMPNAMLALASDHHTRVGEVREISLTDGTRIWLNTASAFNADYHALLRRLRLLEGEMLVETAADPTRPFVVDSEQGRMRALGTRFTVRLANDTTYLNVFEGAVEVLPKEAKTAHVVQAGQQVTFTSTLISRTVRAEPAREAWSKGVLLAEDISLQELITELNRYHYGYLHVAPDAADLRVLGGYPLNDRDTTLTMLENVLPIDIKRTLPWWITINAKTPPK